MRRAHRFGALLGFAGLAILFAVSAPVPAQDLGRFFINRLSGKCIDVAGAPGMRNGDPLQLWTCELSGYNSDNGSVTDQRWRMTPEGFIQNTVSGKCVDVAGAPGIQTGDKIQLWDCEWTGYNRDNGSVTDQKWIITSDGFIQNRISGKCIDVAGAPGMRDGDRLQLWDCESTGYNRDNGSVTDQRWR